MADIITRFGLMARRGKEWYDSAFAPKVVSWALVDLLFTIVVMFSMKGKVILTLPWDAARIAAPLLGRAAAMQAARFAEVAVGGERAYDGLRHGRAAQGQDSQPERAGPQGVRGGRLKRPEGERPPTPRWLVAQVRRFRRGCAAAQTAALPARLGLPTACESTRCPNRGKCLSEREATFLVLGDRCTRGCRFCALKRGRLARAVGELALEHAVITSVTPDDLPDEGATQCAAVMRALGTRRPEVKVELLVPGLGHRSMAAGPLVRSSYRAPLHFQELVA